MSSGAAGGANYRTPGLGEARSLALHRRPRARRGHRQRGRRDLRRARWTLLRPGGRIATYGATTGPGAASSSCARCSGGRSSCWAPPWAARPSSRDMLDLYARDGAAPGRGSGLPARRGRRRPPAHGRGRAVRQDRPGRRLMRLREIQADHYRIPLPVALSDSTHGTIEGFELITVRVRDADGAEGVGYTYTVGAGGAAVHALLARDLAPCWPGATPSGSRRCGRRCGGRCTTAAAAARQVLAISAVDIALWDLARGGRARRCGACSAASIRACRATPAASTSTSRWTAAAPDRRQPRARLPRHQDEGRPPVAPRGRRARARDARASRRRVSR